LGKRTGDQGRAHTKEKGIHHRVVVGDRYPSPY
jgi:hypothetical protein